MITKPGKRCLTPAVLVAASLAATAAAADTLNAVFNSAADVPVTADTYTAAGNTVDFTLNFAPATGTSLTVVNDTGLAPITGTFDNLTNGQAVTLSYGGTTYVFVANYNSGNGNDLVLVWAGSRGFAWGWNNHGQLGVSPSGGWTQPAPVVATGVLCGKTVVALAAGAYHSLALCSDGTLAAWGWNASGQLGDNSTTDRVLPVAVNTAPGTSALYSRRVVAITAGEGHSLALCSDGTLAAWGFNAWGQLGDNTTLPRKVPVAVNTDSGTSALYGRIAVALATGARHSLALCSDGTVAAWGYNYAGQLGDNTTTDRKAPVMVKTNSGVSALYGKTVLAVVAGGYHNLALCSDGLLTAWGSGFYGTLGDNTGYDRWVPVAVNTNGGLSALYGKTVVGIAAGWEHSLALCSDGTAAAWGYNSYGQLGDNTTQTRLVPVAVSTAAGLSALSGKTVVSLAAGLTHSLATCSDGTAAAWGYNFYGQLGDSTTTSRQVPVAVSTNTLAATHRFTRLFSGAVAGHTLATVAAPPASPIFLAGAQKLVDSSFWCVFTNTPGAFFSALAATNPALPQSGWTALGGITELSPGQFQFTDPQATNSPRRFYRVRSP